VNYLAHLYLSGDDPEWKIGGLLGDFVKGPLSGDFPKPVEAGITLHRRVDAFTDRQPEVQQAIARFEPPFRRFGGILTDLCYDHFLAANWLLYHPQPLANFCSEFYQALACYSGDLPPRVQHFCEIAPRVNWLENYAEFAQLELMLERIGQRFRKPVPLQLAFPQLAQHYPLLHDEFRQVFPRLIEFCEKQRLESA